MKKILALLLCLMLIGTVSALAEYDTHVNFTINAGHTNAAMDYNSDNLYKLVSEKFNFDYEVFPVSKDAQDDKIRIWINGGTMPDSVTWRNFNYQEDIEKAIKDAELHAEEDKKAKEKIETRNQAEAMIFQSEKAMTDAGDKLTDEDKAPVKAAIDKLRETLKGDDDEAVKADSEALTQALYAISAKLYQQDPNAQQGDFGGAQQNADGSYNADFTDKSDN